MGDSPPEFLDLSCEDCGTRFRIRPTKGRLPRGPVECPSCSKPVAIEAKAPPVPAAAVFRSRKGVKSEEMRVMEALKSLPDSTSVSGTLMGMADSLANPTRPRLEESTAAAYSDDLFPGDSSDFDDHPVSHTPTHKMFALDEHSESAFNNRTKAPWESESANQAARQANIIAKIKARKTEPNLQALSKSDVLAAAALISPKKLAKTEQTESPAKLASSPSGERPKLADLLKQVREKRGPFVSSSVVEDTPSSDMDDELVEGFFPSDQEIVNELDRALPDPLSAPKQDNRMTPFGKARAETVVRALESHGMAAEKTGSGFIRIPTAEILDLIGTGTYRLQVENVVYEPIDEVGIRRLVRTEFLTGDELVSERGGDWIPMRDHAFFKPNTRHEPMTEELDISEAEALEELFESPLVEPPPLLGRSDSSGEMFPTIGHLSADQSAEIELAYFEHSSSEIISDARAEPAPSVDAPLTAELELDDLDELQPVAEAAPPDMPSVEAVPIPPRPARSVWPILGGVLVAGLIVGGLFRNQLFGSPEDAPIVAPVVKNMPDPPPALAETATQVVEKPVTNTAAQLLVAEPTIAEPTIADAVVDLDPAGIRNLKAPDLVNPSIHKEGKTPALKFSLNGAPVTLLVDTGEPQRAYRSNLAVAALCRAAKCGIDFAKTQEAFISADELKAAGLELGGVLSSYDDTSGIRGVLRWHVEGGAQLPLAELTPVWRKWMGLSDQDLDKAVSESEQDLTKAIGEDRTKALLAQTGQLRVRDLIRQISNVLVLDYLTNNFERFESGQGPETWNLAVKNGRVVSMDDGGAFQPRASTRIKGRFSWVEKFDQEVFDSLSLLKQESLDSEVFQDSTGAERVALRVFWKQHQAYVDRVQKETLRRPDTLFF